MLVLKTKFRPTPRGIKIVSKKDRKEMIDTLEKLCHNKLNMTLEQVMREIVIRDFGANGEKERMEQIHSNTVKYVNGEAGIGLTLLGKLAERVGFTCVFQVKFPSKESTLIIEEN